MEAHTTLVGLDSTKDWKTALDQLLEAYNRDTQGIAIDLATYGVSKSGAAKVIWRYRRRETAPQRKMKSAIIKLHRQVFGEKKGVSGGAGS